MLHNVLNSNVVYFSFRGKMAAVIETLDVRTFLHNIFVVFSWFKNLCRLPFPMNEKEKNIYALTSKDIRLPEKRSCQWNYVHDGIFNIKDYEGLKNVKVSIFVKCYTEAVVFSYKPVPLAENYSKRNAHQNKSQRYNEERIAEDFRILSEKEYCGPCINNDKITTDKCVQADGNEYKPAKARVFLKAMFCKKCHKTLLPRPTSSEHQYHNRELSGVVTPIKSDETGNLFIPKENINFALWKISELYPEMTDTMCRKTTFITYPRHWYFMQFNSLWNIDAFVDAGFFLNSGKKLNVSFFRFIILESIYLG